jgi:Cu(I)/Ag(I) efflux system membrane fusion protein
MTMGFALDETLDPAALITGQEMTLTFTRPDGMTMILASAEPITPPMEVSGTINAIDAAAGMANITHGPMMEIGMPGMTMDFAIDPSVDVSRLPEGDEVTLLLKRNADFSLTLVGVAAAPEVIQ